MIQKWIQKIKGILGEMPLGAPLVVQTVFVMKKLAPSAPKVRPRTKREAKLLQNEPKMIKTCLEKQPRD